MDSATVITIVFPRLVHTELSEGKVTWKLAGDLHELPPVACWNQIICSNRYLWGQEILRLPGCYKWRKRSIMLMNRGAPWRAANSGRPSCASAEETTLRVRQTGTESSGTATTTWRYRHFDWANQNPICSRMNIWKTVESPEHGSKPELVHARANEKWGK